MPNSDVNLQAKLEHDSTTSQVSTDRQLQCSHYYNEVPIMLFNYYRNLSNLGSIQPTNLHGFGYL